MSEDNDIRRNSVSSKKTKSVSVSGKSLVNIGVVILALLIGFWIGTYYQKHHDKSSNTSTTAFRGFGAPGGGAGFRRGGANFGTVTAISSSSISVTTSSGSSKTFNITSSTVINDGGQTVSYTDIQNGAKVIVATTSATSTDAARILVNPSFGGFGGGQSAPNGSSTNNTQPQPTGSSTGSTTN